VSADAKNTTAISNDAIGKMARIRRREGQPQ
jgi:hypothetical protein